MRGMSCLRGPVASDHWFFISCCILPWREILSEQGSADSRISESLRPSPCHDPRFWALIAVAACSQKGDVYHVKSRRLWTAQSLLYPAACLVGNRRRAFRKESVS